MENKKKTVSVKKLRFGLGVKKKPNIGLKIEKIQLNQDNNFGKISSSQVLDDMSDIQEILELFDKSEIRENYDEVKFNSGMTSSESPGNCNSNVDFKIRKKEFIIRRSVRIQTTKS